MRAVTVIAMRTIGTRMTALRNRRPVRRLASSCNRWHDFGDGVGVAGGGDRYLGDCEGWGGFSSTNDAPGAGCGDDGGVNIDDEGEGKGVR